MQSMMGFTKATSQANQLPKLAADPDKDRRSRLSVHRVWATVRDKAGYLGALRYQRVDGVFVAGGADNRRNSRHGLPLGHHVG
jgi:hypothetical protein